MLKKDAFVQQLIDSYGNWVCTEDNQNCAGGSARMTSALYPYEDVLADSRQQPDD